MTGYNTIPAQQQRLRARREDAVARLDGELAGAQLVRQANLPVLGMPVLSAVERSETQIAGRCPSITSRTTPAPRLWRTTWITTSAFRNTLFQQVRPSTRTEVSSEHTTRARRSRAKIAPTSASKHGMARWKGAPSLIASPNKSSSRRLSRRWLIAWLSLAGREMELVAGALCRPVTAHDPDMANMRVMKTCRVARKGPTYVQSSERTFIIRQRPKHARRPRWGRPLRRKVANFSYCLRKAFLK